MRETVSLSSQGQLTLPKALLKKHGFKLGGSIEIDDDAGKVTLRPEPAVKIRMYTDREIARWAKLDSWGPGEREAWLKSIRQKKKKK
jgi:bifunctional DNA-binding transcriptional regulator/antitoxin component of YhaV-PrlF toxin-antitoxin module